MRCFAKSLHVQRRGFSLVEVLIVIAILGIVATIAAVNTIGALPHTNLEKAQEEVTMLLSQARTLSQSEEVATRVVFDTATPPHYWYERQDRTTLAWSMATAGGGKQQLPKNITISGNTFPGQTVTFSARGTLVVGGTITLRNSKGETAALTGNVATGRFPLTGGSTR
jgi:type II secretion system protein H